MFHLYVAGSRLSHLAPRLLGALAVALLLAVGGFLSGAHPALASGWGCVCFVHTSTAANTFGDFTDIDDNTTPYPLTPQSKIFVTSRLIRWGVSNPHPIGVWFNDRQGQWSIFNEDLAPMPVGAEFNVEIDWGGAQTMTATTANTLADFTMLNVNDPFSDSNPPSLVVTPNWGTSGVYDPHPIGVSQGAGSVWFIFNEDLAPMPLGVSFNVVNSPEVEQGTTITAVPGVNAWGDYVLMNAPEFSNDPNAAFVVTPSVGTTGAFDPHPVGVLYMGTQWAIVNEDGAPMPAGVSFNVALAV